MQIVWVENILSPSAIILTETLNVAELISFETPSQVGHVKRGTSSTFQENLVFYHLPILRLRFGF